MRHLRPDTLLLLAALLGLSVPLSGWAQESDVSDIEPAVSGQALDANAPTDDAAADRENDAGPALEAGVTRSASSSGVIDQLDLGSTTITGNQELPKVLYILPWKQSDLGDLVGRPVNSLLDEVLEPVDKEVFQRQSRYYETLYGEDPADTAE